MHKRSLVLPKIELPPPLKHSVVREFTFTDQDFSRICRLIYDYAGIALNPSKQDMVYGRLTKRLRALHFKSFNEYLSYLERPNNESERELFTNSLTTNLTSFFREAHHFPILAEHLKTREKPPLSIWCSACSTGEEAWSLAMTACETFDSLRPPVRILATDLDTHVLEAAASGIYASDKVSKLLPRQIHRFFEHTPNGDYQVKRELRDLVSFKKLNLTANHWPISGGFDAIFCRNVMIYFDKATQLEVLKKFAPLLKSDGLLFVGHSENFYLAADLFHLRGKTVYELAKNSPLHPVKRNLVSFSAHG